MKVWTVVVAAPAVLCCPLSSSSVLLDVFPIITFSLRDFTQEPCSGSPKQVHLNSALVAMPFARAHSSALESWSVTPVNSKRSSSARMSLSPPHPMITAFSSIGAKSNE